MHVYHKGDGRPRPHLQYLSFLSFSFSASECHGFVAVLDAKSCKLIRVLIVISIYQ